MLKSIILVILSRSPLDWLVGLPLQYPLNCVVLIFCNIVKLCVSADAIKNDNLSIPKVKLETGITCFQYTCSLLLINGRITRKTEPLSFKAFLSSDSTLSTYLSSRPLKKKTEQNRHLFSSFIIKLYTFLKKNQNSEFLKPILELDCTNFENCNWKISIFIFKLQMF